MQPHLIKFSTTKLAVKSLINYQALALFSMLLTCTVFHDNIWQVLKKIPRKPLLPIVSQQRVLVKWTVVKTTTKAYSVLHCWTVKVFKTCLKTCHFILSENTQLSLKRHFTKEMLMGMSFTFILCISLFSDVAIFPTVFQNWNPALRAQFACS